MENRDTMTIAVDVAGLAEADRRLDGAPAGEIVTWAHEFSAGRMIVTSSFSDAVLVDVVAGTVPDAQFVFIDTGSHFPETLEYVERIRRHYDLSLEILSAGVAPDVSPCGTAECCQLRKVAPLRTALEGKLVWMTGIRRSETPERTAAPCIGWDTKYGIVKVNPIVAWSDDDVLDYIEHHDLPIHPLTHEGYLSIGCAPVTVPTLDPDDPRSGRWAGSSKTECGLHL